MVSPRKVTLFAFWGRKSNLELQLPFIQRILDDHPQVEFHGWNLAREPSDDTYIRTLGGDRLVIRNDFRGPRSWTKMGRVWAYYSNHSAFSDRLFVKIDDDVVFLQTDAFGDFLRMLDEVSGDGHAVVSADVVNNGACTPLHPDLWEQFMSLKIPLLDVHLSNAFAGLAHDYMAEQWQALLDRELRLIPSDEWLSINVVGMDWRTLCALSRYIGRRSPNWIANRQWDPRARIGDEGAANMLPRYLLQGMLAAHLWFGPQKITADQASAWRRQYAAIGQEYLAVRKPNTLVES